MDWNITEDFLQGVMLKLGPSQLLFAEIKCSPYFSLMFWGYCKSMTEKDWCFMRRDGKACVTTVIREKRSQINGQGGGQGGRCEQSG